MSGLPFFRHLDYGPGAGVDDAGLAGIQAVLDRGDAEDWRELLSVLRRDPWGETAMRVQRLLPHLESYGTAAAMEAWLNRCRAGVAAPAETLAGLRRAHGLTQREMAEMLGVSQAQVARLEGGLNPTLGSLRRYLAALGLAPVALVASGGGGPAVVRLPRETPDGGRRTERPKDAAGSR